MTAADADADIRSRLIGEYVQITGERVDRVCAAWIALEKNPDATVIGEELMRELHTIKGEAMLMRFTDVSTVSHRMEELLLFAKERSFRVPAAFGHLLLAGANTILSLTRKKSGTQQNVDVSTLLDLFDELLEGEGGPRTTPPDIGALAGMTTRDLPIEDRMLRMECTTAEKLLDTALLVESAFRRNRDTTRELAASSSEASRRLREGREAIQAAERVEMLAGWLSKQIEAEEAHVQHLRELALRVRYVSLAELLGRVGLAAKELAKEQGKLVGVEVKADGLLLDRFVADGVSEAILHIARNAVDHGVEPPDERKRAGKSGAGRIRVTATIEHVFLVLSFCDDGRGIDLSRVRRQAVLRGLLSEQQAETVADHRLYELLFEPRFSTKTSATQSSGRGIGLDIVKRHVEQASGSVSIAGAPAGGTEVIIRLPSTWCRLDQLHPMRL
jgi:two-component system, chemotaxis family, sensor kinase CheA